MKIQFTKSIFFLAAGLLIVGFLSAQPRLASEYYNTTMGSTEEHGAAVGFTWETNASGDVVITLSEVDGGAAGTSLFRNNGMCPDDLSRFKVGGQNASNYFEREYSELTQVYTLKLKDGVDAPALGTAITFNNHLVEYKTSINPDAWPNLTFSYTYGTRCAILAQPTNIAISASKEITFDAVVGATSYKAFVYGLGEYCHEQVVSSGDVLNFSPRIASTYQVYVQAYGADDSFSPASDAYDWVISTGTPGGYAPITTIKDYPIQDGSNTESKVLITMTTNLENGDIEVIIAPQEGGDAENTYWYEDGMRIGGFKYNSENTFSSYFDPEYYVGHNAPAGTTKLLFHPKTTGEYIPQYGNIISFKNNYIIWRYKADAGHVFPNNITLPDYIYGTNTDVNNDHVAPVILITEINSTVNSVTLQVDVTEKNDAGDDCALRFLTIRDDVNSYAEEDLVLDGESQITLSGLEYNTTYYFTVKAEDLGGNITEETKTVVLPFNTELNLAHEGDCEAGATQGANAASRAVDNDLTTFWTSYATGDENTWWTVDMKAAYDVNRIQITFNDIAAPYCIYSSMNGMDWTPVVLDETASPGSTKEYSDLVLSAQYFKVTSTKRNFGIKEFEVYGTAFAAPDAVAPTVVVTCPAKTVTSATLQIVATDKDDAGEDGTIRAINISGDNDFVTQKNVTLNGSNQITLSDLKDNTTYTFTVTVIDLAGNSTSENIVVELPFNTELNLALNKSDVKGGYCQFSDHTPEGDALQYPKANDGNPSTSYSAYGAPSADDAWWQVNLETIYDIAEIKINWASDYSTGYTLYGSLDGTNWYLIGKDAATEAGEKTTSVEASAQYIKVCSYKKANIVIKEVEVYASGFSTLEDSKPELTYAELLNATDEEVTIEVGGVDITTAPVQYYVVGIGDPQTVSATNNIITLTIVPNTHYDITVQAMDASGNKSNAKEFSFGSSGSASGIYVRGTFPHIGGWGTGEGDLKAEAQLTTTAQPGIDAVTISASAGTYTYKLYNATTSRWTDNNSSGVTDRSLTLANDVDVTIYATSEDFFYSNYDAFVLSGTAVGENKTLVWNAEHTKATWVGSVSAGTYQVSHAGGAHPFFSEAQTFDGDYVYGMFTLDLTKMTGTWGYVELAFADDADDNTSIISENNGRIANVTLNRTIVADNTWYTLCLPFDMSAEKVNEVFGASTIAELTGAEDRGSLIHLNFDYVDAIVAGKPYLFKAGETFNAGSTIEGVTIKNEGPTETGDELMKFIGTYDQIVLENQNQRFVADDDYLYSPAAGGTTMGAFRCYFTIPGGSSAGAPGKRAKIVFGHQSPTGMDQITEQTAPAKFMFNGVLYIIRDGKTYNAQGQMIQ